jgi:hypothetical protein
MLFYHNAAKAFAVVPDASAVNEEWRQLDDKLMYDILIDWTALRIREFCAADSIIYFAIGSPHLDSIRDKLKALLDAEWQTKGLNTLISFLTEHMDDDLGEVLIIHDKELCNEP